MDYEIAVIRLANHANLSDSDVVDASESLVFNLWQTRNATFVPPLSELVDDVLHCLESVNQHVNRSFFLQGEFRADPISEDLVFTVSTIVDACQEYALVWEVQHSQSKALCLTLRQKGWMISRAWCGILHGDINSLKLYINESMLMSL